MSNPDEAPPIVTLLEPATAAKHLGVSASGLRRLGPLYEKVHGELPRKGTGAEDKRARLWPQEAVERLQAARDLVDRERYRTISEALKALQSGAVDEPIDLEPGHRHAGADIATQQALQRLLEEMQALRAEVAELRDETPPKKEPHDLRHGLLVRLALRLEKWMNRD